MPVRVAVCFGPHSVARTVGLQMTVPLLTRDRRQAPGVAKGFVTFPLFEVVERLTGRDPACRMVRWCWRDKWRKTQQMAHDKHPFPGLRYTVISSVVKMMANNITMRLKIRSNGVETALVFTGFEGLDILNHEHLRPEFLHGPYQSAVKATSGTFFNSSPFTVERNILTGKTTYNEIGRSWQAFNMFPDIAFYNFPSNVAAVSSRRRRIYLISPHNIKNSTVIRLAEKRETSTKS